MTISETIRNRKSTRAYTDEPISQAIINKIVEAGQWAPNAGQFHISVITRKSLLEKINTITHEAMKKSEREFLRQRAALPGYQPIYNAPVLFIITAPDDAPYSAVNAALAAENMLIEATGCGLGSCLLASIGLAFNNTGNKELASEAGIPENYSFQCGVIIGHAEDENRFSSDERNKKGSISFID